MKAIDQPYRALVFCMNYNSQRQWYREIIEKTDLNVAFTDGSPSARKKIYASSWEVLLVRYSTLIRDVDILDRLRADVMILDEPSAPSVGGHHPTTRTSQSLKQLATKYNRVVLLDATPMQKNPLADLHSLFDIFAPAALPAYRKLEKQYIRRKWERVRRGRKWIMESKIQGYKDMDKFKELVRPYIMRRQDVTGMPAIQTSTQWLTLLPSQRKYYNEARSGIIRIWENKGTPDEKYKDMVTGFHSLMYAVDSTYAFEDPEPESVKLDWLVRFLKFGKEPGDKVVVFSRFKKPIAHMMERFEEEGIPALRLTGDETKEEQAAAYDRFRDPTSGYQVIVGTTVLERALNLQIAKYLILFNTIFNPSRVEQLAGRLRRRMSTHDTIFVISLLTERTLEQALYERMAELAAVPDYIFNESSDLFEDLRPHDIIKLLGI